MALIYDIGLAMALLVGGAIGLLITVARYEHIAFRQRQYEMEMAEGRELYAALAMLRRIKPGHAADDKASAA